jgi:hypothetical protein
MAKTAGRPETLVGLWTDGRKINSGIAKWQLLLLYIHVDDDGAKPCKGDLLFGNRNVA